MIFSRLIVIAPAMLLPMAASAQVVDGSLQPLASATNAASEPDGTIIVTALPAPVAADAYGVERIDRDGLNDTAAGSLESALASIPGFQQFRRSDSRSANPSAQGITLRAIGGNATSRTLLVRDGVPVADAFFGFIPFAALPVEELAGVRITRGSGTGPFGAGALAGVIELDSLALAERDRLSLGITGGSRGAWQGDAALVLPLGAGHVALDVHHDRGTGFFTTPLSQRVAASVPARYRASSAALAASVPVTPHTALSARIGLFRDDRTLRFAGANSRAEGVDASVRLTGTGRWQWEALGWLQARDFSNIVVSATSFRPVLDQRDTPTTGWGAKLELRPPLGSDRTLRLGVDVRSGDGVAIEDVLATSGLRTLNRRAGGSSVIIGGFVESDARFGPISLSGGARIDQWQLDNGMLQEFRANGSVQTDTQLAKRSGAIASFRAAAAWQIAGPLTLRGSAYSGFRIPTLNELYRGFTVFPVVTRANPALEPERLRGGEIAAEWTPLAGVRLTLTGFDNRLSEAITNVTIAPNLRQRRNIASLRARGVEAGAQIVLGQWRLDAGWSYSDARLRSSATDTAAAALDGLRPAQSPVVAGGAAVGWRSPSGGLVQLSLRHVGVQFEDDRNIDRLAAATTVDALVRQPLGPRLSLVLRGENLFNVDVITRNAGGSIDLGAPRTLWLGLRWTSVADMKLATLKRLGTERISNP